MKLFKQTIITSIYIIILCLSVVTKADNFEIVKDGQTYSCSPASSSNCWENCRKDNNSFSYCRSYCKVTLPACWSACRSDNNSFRYCRSYCDIKQDECWGSCQTDNNSFTYCRSYCDTSTPSCWDACAHDNNSFRYCQSYCSNQSPFNLLLKEISSDLLREHKPKQ